MKKIINKDTLLKLLPYIIVFSIATFLFFQTHIAFLNDSEFYYKNATVILGLIDASEYFAIRGFGYPLYLSLFIKLFGNNFFAITISAYVIYIALIILAFYIINLFLNKSSLINMLIIYGLFLVFILFNTLIIGYSSLILTENISILLMEIVFILLYKWINLNPTEHKIKSIVYIFAFAILMIYLYQCKQTMAAYMLIMMFVIVLFSFIKKKKFKEFIYRSGTILICLILTYGQIKIWNNFLIDIKKDAGINTNEADSINLFTSGMLSGSGIAYRNGDYFCKEELINKNVYISKKKQQRLKESLSKNCNDITYFSLYNSEGKLIDEDFIVNKNLNIFTTINLLVDKIIEQPILILGHYYDNYLWTINVYDYEIDGYNYKLVKEFTNQTKENGPNGMFVLDYENILWRDVSNYSESKIKGISNFSKKISNGKVIKTIHANYSKYYLDMFKYTYLVIPFIFILSCILYIKCKKQEYSNLLLGILTLTGSSFGFTLFLAFTGQIIDRYAYVSYPLTLIGLLLCFISYKTNLSKKNDK